MSGVSDNSSNGNSYLNLIQKKLIEQSALIFNKNQAFGPGEAALTTMMIGALTFIFFKKIRTGLAFGIGIYIGYNFDYYNIKSKELVNRYKLTG